MRFILKDGLVYIVENNGLYNNNIEGTVEAPDLVNYTIDYSVNNSDFKPLKKGKAVIPFNALKTTKLILKFRATKDRDIKYFKTDEIPLTQAIVFGGTMEDWYPAILQDVLKRLETLEVLTKHKLDSTERDLKGTMKQIVETFEEINKKGSLF
jgi:hypothetical protein